jgi:hypothetical protein
VDLARCRARIGENNILVQDIDGDGKMDIVTPSYVLPEQPYFMDPGAIQPIVPRGCAAGYRLRQRAINLAGTQPASPYNVVWWEKARENRNNARTGTWIMHTIGPGYPCSPDNCSTASGSSSFCNHLAAWVRWNKQAGFTACSNFPSTSSAFWDAPASATIS